MAQLAAADGKLDKTYPDGAGKVPEDQPAGAAISVPKAASMVDHAAGIMDGCKQTASYGGHGAEHPATGSPIPNPTMDLKSDYECSAQSQQE